MADSPRYPEVHIADLSRNAKRQTSCVRLTPRASLRAQNSSVRLPLTGPMSRYHLSCSSTHTTSLTATFGPRISSWADFSEVE